MTAQMPIAANRRLTVRLAHCEADLQSVQRLRWRVFFEEMGAAADPALAGDRCDRDAYDALCDHLLVIDQDRLERDGPDAAVVGTYRLLREGVARRHAGFYSAGEFDLNPLLATRADGREALELGRSCVLPEYRTSATISMLWRGIAEYISANRIGLLFGCASFPGVDPDAFAPALSYLYHNHLAPAGTAPSVLPGKGVSMERLPRGSYDQRRALFQLPPLVKGYLRVGASFGDGAYIDHAFNTVDVCVVMPVDAIADRYAARFSVAA
ncbi:GNAT family N-acetyltransferase [Novosphingobium sp. FSY-8]|uniref:L-ornithine N(alpha)-acyltransferase n=1 Tax=Novosphingobium ovatum TaxID=1908523 RepID=A0ABW9XDZ2_9SPHN|nr:GNAT family N-acyltransferase [Novosphingobium ovatum]NBC36755.1 GNAT family N-acetyltransferase [Novosphingobium ovatum]